MAERELRRELGAAGVRFAYSLYGLTIHTELDLDQPPAAHGGGSGEEVTIALGPPLRGTADPPRGAELAVAIIGDAVLYRIVKAGPDRAAMWFEEVGRFDIDSALGTISVRPLSEGRSSLVRVLLPSTVLGAFLGLRGRCALHGSAVELDRGEAVVVVAGSGGGKSSLAAHLCAAGARLVTDDVAALDVGEPTPRCYAGTWTLRMRDGAAVRALAGALELDDLTSDGRIVMRPAFTSRTLLPVRAVLVPELSTEIDEIAAVRLRDHEAALALIRHPRTLGWIDPGATRAHFEGTSVLAGTVPVLALAVPQSALQDPYLGSRLWELVERAAG